MAIWLDDVSFCCESTRWLSSVGVLLSEGSEVDFFIFLSGLSFSCFVVAVWCSLFSRNELNEGKLSGL